MRRWIVLGVIGATAVAVALGRLEFSAEVRGEQPVAMKVPAPELREIEAWVNSKPLQLKDLRGRVVVLHFWTFG